MMGGNRLKNGLECTILHFEGLNVQITLTVFLSALNAALSAGEQE